MTVLLSLIVVLAVIGMALAASTCEDYGKDKAACLAASEDGIKCAACTSAAAGANCMQETSAKTLPSSVFQCTYQSTSSSSSSFSSSLNSTLAAYNSGAAVSYGNAHCASDSSWLCAEFVARSLHAGGEFPGVSDYGNYNGYNLRYVPDLHRALKAAGWTQSASGLNCGSAGNVLIYGADDHAALAIGNCLLDQHNPSRCQTTANWGTNIVMKK